MGRGHLHIVISELERAFEELSVSPDQHALESMGLLIYEAMTGPAREFHSLPHIFGLAQGQQPLEVLAAYFHDVVYFQIDQNLPPRIAEILYPWVEHRPEGLRLRGHAAFTTLPQRLCLEVFSLKGDEVLVLKDGLNEFLSALTAVACLSPWLSLKDLLTILACLETTIPFRNVPGHSHAIEALRQRLTATVQRHQEIAASPTDVLQMVQAAVRLSNRDLSSFAQVSVRAFLKDSLRLFVESNQGVQRELSFAARPLRDGLWRMQQFFAQTLDAEGIFHRCADVPPEAVFQTMQTRARKNVGLGTLFLGAKLYAACLVDAIAQVSGGDVTYYYLLGEPEDPANVSAGLMDALLSQPRHRETDERVLLHLLEDPGLSDVPMLRAHAAFTALILKHMSEEAVLGQSRATSAYCQGDIAALDFLLQQPPQLIKTLCRLIAAVAKPRREVLLALSSSLDKASA